MGRWIYPLILGVLAIGGDVLTKEKIEKATFAGGCFWCMEPPFEKTAGVISVAAGYTGGETPDPTYEEVGMGLTGHIEAIQITYDPAKVSYQGLLDLFWRQIDPTDPGGQFADRGPQYRSAIFYHNEEQKRLAIASKEAPPRLFRKVHFTPRRIITKTITRRTRPVTRSTGLARVVMILSLRPGVRVQNPAPIRTSKRGSPPCSTM